MRPSLVVQLLRVESAVLHLLLPLRQPPGRCIGGGSRREVLLSLSTLDTFRHGLPMGKSGPDVVTTGAWASFGCYFCTYTCACAMLDVSFVLYMYAFLPLGLSPRFTIRKTRGADGGSQPQHSSIWGFAQWCIVLKVDPRAESSIPVRFVSLVMYGSTCQAKNRSGFTRKRCPKIESY